MYVVTEAPEPQQADALADGETVVQLSHEDRVVLGLVSCLIALGVGARVAGSFGS